MHLSKRRIADFHMAVDDTACSADAAIQAGIETDCSPDAIDVEVAYALPDRQTLLQISVPAGTTAREAAIKSTLDLYYPQLDLKSNPIGIFGEAVSDDTVLKAGDRLEFYRPLAADPKELRRRRASRK